jgi:glycosyltransferase involved in cell wall biosynthesis
VRFGLVVYGSLESVSGGYLYDRRLVEYLRRQGDEVDVIRIPWRNYAAHLADNFQFALQHRLASSGVDVLLEDELNHPSLFWVNYHLRQQRAFPIVSIVHHLRSSELHPAGFMPIYRWVEKRYLQSIDGFIFNSQTTRRTVETLLGRPAEGIVATPAGDQWGKGALPQEKNDCEDEAEGLRLLFVGNLIRRKGLHTLLAGLARLSDAHWTLHIVGEAVDRAYVREVRRLAAPLGKRVKFLGRLEGGSLRQEFCWGQALVVPSSYEGFGIVYLEGMAFGMPAVATTAGAAGEIIQDGVNGFLVSREDPKALAEALWKLMQDRTRLEEMSQAARLRYQSFPTWDQTAEKIREYIHETSFFYTLPGFETQR